MVDGVTPCQPGGWRRHLFHSVRHHSLSQQRWGDVAFLGFGWYHDILVRTLLPSHVRDLAADFVRSGYVLQTLLLLLCH
jgi:hypothetical protein